MSLYVSQEELDFSNKTIILGIPSVGNVGQLALDFLISSFDAKRVGYLDSQYILPVVGNDPYLTEKSKTGELHTSAEVYSIPSVDSVLLIIIRAPITSAKRFANELIQWLIQAKITKLVILSSANSSWRMDNMIRNQSNIIVKSQTVGDIWTNSLLLQHAPPLGAEHQADLNVNLISHETHRLQQSITYPQEETSEQKMVRGVGKSLLSSSSEHKINTALVLVMCNEGDNTPHGIYLAQLVAHDIIHEGNQEQLSQIKWKVPSSWSYLFGPPADSSLY